MPQWNGTEESIGEITALKRQDLHDIAQETLQKVYKYVKPIMVKRNYRVHKLAEFLPKNANLLGLNVNRGQRINIRLRYAHNPKSFLPFESVLGTMLHELCHNTYGPHDQRFFRLLDELTRDMEDLIAKGFSGDPFVGLGPGRRLATAPGNGALSISRSGARAAGVKYKVGKGTKLGGSGPSIANRRLSPKEMAFRAAERRREADLVCKTAQKVNDLRPDEQGEVVDLTIDDNDDHNENRTHKENRTANSRGEPEIIVILDD